MNQCYGLDHARNADYMHDIEDSSETKEIPEGMLQAHVEISKNVFAFVME